MLGPPPQDRSGASATRYSGKKWPIFPRSTILVNPIGGEEKASAVLTTSEDRYGLEDIYRRLLMASRLSIVKGGRANHSFNGNEYAIREAEYAVIADNTVVTSVLAEVFHKTGREGVINLADDWTMEKLKRSGSINPYLMREFERVFSNDLPTVSRITSKNMRALTRQSMASRCSIRGENIGSLG